MKSKIIYYSPIPHSPTSVENLNVPIKVDGSFAEKTSLFNCPVWQHQNSRTFTVYASSKLHLQIDKKSDLLFSENLKQSELEQYASLMAYNTSETSIVQIHCPYSNFYWTDCKDIWISVLPHPLTALNNNFYHCGGWFNLSNWDRQINIGAVVVDSDKPIIINRGDPLYNIKFHTKNQNDQFKLIYKEIDYNRYEKMLKRTNFVQKLRLSSGFNYQDIIFESKKESKCPFRFFWNK